ncbi:hypothetical protein SUNI508_13767 [Seiridium unicorne]|uniref:Gelsolin n=1 Tax=Seiridium unicorne TaxID=138068 RepID=A0ABR2VBS0_9PEZI
MSEDVSKFLEQVRELGDRRAEEDEARSRELEQKILADRKERQARRAERARSISPQKSSPANTPPPATQRPTTPASQRLVLDSSPIIDRPASPNTPGDPPQADTMATHDFYSTSASKENESPFDAENKRASNPLSPTRSATVRGLNWQRRPNSQASNGSRSRPLSMFAAENAARSSTIPSEPTSATEAVSRDQITQALSSKDPSWFRQTADRGATSGAYRKSQVEDTERADASTINAKLPGMTRRPSTEPGMDEPGQRPDSPGLPRVLGSPLPLRTSQRLDPPSAKNEDPRDTDGTMERQPLASPPSPARGDRPISPTKGLGGFVQSAMMKRSDSVNKRWSVRSPEGLQRADSVASSRNSYIAPRATTGAPSRPTSLGRDNSLETTSRPGSSQGKIDPPADAQTEESISRKISDSLKPDTQSPREPDVQDDDKNTPPTSPSKTMDPRRWSPTKASWLESALNKPESPKPKATPTSSNQPAWLAEIAKAKAQKTANPATEVSRAPTTSHKHQVSIGGLMRASAPGIGAKPASMTSSAVSSPTVVTHRTGPGSIRNNSVSSVVAAEGEREIGNAADTAATTVHTTTSKPKPETPPKMDFRASLKPKPAPPTSGAAGNNDFKSVIGSLRKTATQNYVAPDELKSNILRGKAALNLTGGPKKTERKDEFKDAILAKKKEFSKAQVEGRGVARHSSTASEQPVPEGLVKRFELGRSKSFKRDTAPADMLDAVEQHKASPRSFERPRLHEKQDSRSSILSSEERRPSIGLQRESAQEGVTPKPADASAPMPVLQKETSAPGRLQGKVGGSVLANRFNPALAGLLARGPPPMATGSPSGADDGETRGTSSTSEANAGPKLTHMTKSRARGPKRKAPTSAATNALPTNASDAPAAASTVDKEPTPNPKPVTSGLEAEQASAQAMASKAGAVPYASSSQVQSDGRPKPRPLALADSAKQIAEPAQSEPAKTPRPGRSHVRTKSRVFEQVAAFAAQSSSPSPTKQHETDHTGSQPPSPRKLDLKRVSMFGRDSSPEKSPEREDIPDKKSSVEELKPKPLFSRPASPTVNKPVVQSPSTRFSGRPLPEPEQPRIQAGSKPADPQQSSESPETAAATGTRALPSLPPLASSTTVKPRPLPMEPQQLSRQLPSPGAMSPPPIASPMRSPTKQAVEVSSVLSDFFGSNRPKREYRVDSADLLMQRPTISAPRIQTLNAQLSQFSADGKKIPVPAHHDRVLFEREMYLCSHTFTIDTGKKISEVYFWAGDEVPSSVVEDASIFVGREARSLGGTLIKLQQGKESPEFVAALGGIAIVRRGSSNKYDSLAPHMICGRRFQGQVVFDEVDFTPTALCSGFPFLITSSGRCYLWKGKGSGADELSCARLIGMDYALSGELEEIEDGREPSNFWDLFGGGSRSGSADHWRLKPSYDKYCSRLFRSDATFKQQIVELSPFSQQDLDKTGIYVLDAFFELYIVVGARAQPQYASFHNALEFAQEYAILAAGMEDRPFVPVSTVILEGIPKDMKSVFRKWRDVDSPTIMNPSGGGTGLRRGRSLRIVPLNTALQALRE